MGQYRRPGNLDEALDCLSKGTWQILSGGTDYYPARVQPGPRADILDISALSALRGIAERDGVLAIGARTTWSDLVAAELPPAYDGLRAAAREVGGVQIQNRGTVAGNLCNASPAADGIPPLLSLNASVALQSSKGRRDMPLEEFMTGYRQTARRPDELVTEITIPTHAATAIGGFSKLGARCYLVISITMAAAVLVPDPKGQIADARIAVGACSAVAQRLPGLEQALIGQPLASGLGDLVGDSHLGGLTPIDDIRATAGYRADVARVVVARLLDDLGGGARAGEAA